MKNSECIQKHFCSAVFAVLLVSMVFTPVSSAFAQTVTTTEHRTVTESADGRTRKVTVTRVVTVTEVTEVTEDINADEAVAGTSSSESRSEETASYVGAEARAQELPQSEDPELESVIDGTSLRQLTVTKQVHTVTQEVVTVPDEPVENPAAEKNDSSRTEKTTTTTTTTETVSQEEPAPTQSLEPTQSLAETPVEETETESVTEEKTAEEKTTQKTTTVTTTTTTTTETAAEEPAKEESAEKPVEKTENKPAVETKETVTEEKPAEEKTTQKTTTVTTTTTTTTTEDVAKEIDEPAPEPDSVTTVRRSVVTETAAEEPAPTQSLEPTQSQEPMQSQEPTQSLEPAPEKTETTTVKQTTTKTTTTTTATTTEDVAEEPAPTQSLEPTQSLAEEKEESAKETETKTDTVKTTVTVVETTTTTTETGKEESDTRTWSITADEIYFDPDSATFKTLSKEQIRHNNEVIDSIAKQLLAVDEPVDVQIVGHANNVTNTQREHEEELIPLSLYRAEVIRQQLIKRGVSADCLTSVPMGGTDPVTKWEDHPNWWKNRRVDFIITKLSRAASSRKTATTTTTTTENRKTWTISVDDIYFDPDAATFKTLSASQIKHNNEVIDSVAKQVLALGDDVQVQVVGHANNVSNTEREHIEELIPLSLYRAEVIRQQLIKRGIPASSITSVGKGGEDPVAAWTDRANWWKNRRVDFVVTAPDKNK